ncbi:MAG: hypothetical protein U9R42_09570 [Bacteroidota bacterium]|nr:hypothetical protein [Bacteroidota bacterium]
MGRISRNIIKLIFRFKKKEIEKAKKLIRNKNLDKIGLLYISENSSQDTFIKSFIEKLSIENKEIFSVEFITQQDRMHEKISSKNNFKFEGKDLNFFGLLPKEKSANFLENNFDIIINLSLNNNIYLHYLSFMSIAKLKIGLYNDEFSHIYDFMIDPKDIANLNELISSIENYLGMLTEK